MEENVLQSLMNNDLYFTKTFSHLDSSLFTTTENSVIFDTIKDYVKEYRTRPNFKEVGISIKENNKLNQTLKESTINKFKEIVQDKPVSNTDFIIKKTEKWVQKLKLTQSIFKAADIIQTDEPFEPIIDMVSDALQVSFDTDKGLDYISSITERAEYYHRRLQGIPTGISELDKVLGSGYMNKTLNIIGSVSHGGKSALMAAQAANMTLQGKNVLYLTLEMSEEETAKRIDANILDIDINKLKNTPIAEIESKFIGIKDRLGHLIIKEYPAGSLNVIMIEGLLVELKNNGYDPDIIFIDYLGLMASARISLSTAGGTYGYIKSIAEECHGLAKKIDKPIVTASQLNRCLAPNTIIKKLDGDIELKDIEIGDELIGSDKPVKVLNKVSTKHKAYKVKLKSGKEIIVSGNHRFPTIYGLMSIDLGLKEGVKLSTRLE